jgi:hypothetical protein
MVQIDREHVGERREQQVLAAPSLTMAGLASGSGPQLAAHRFHHRGVRLVRD